MLLRTTSTVGNSPLAELHENGFCVLRNHLPKHLIDACRDALWPALTSYLVTHAEEPNRGPHRHFLPMPFDPPCFVPEFFFDAEILSVVRGAMGDRIVADQWGCDVPLNGSTHQGVHADYQRPLFPEAPGMPLPAYMLNVSFGLIDVTTAHGPIEIAPCSHRMERAKAMKAVEAGQIPLEPQLLALGDVLIRHPWALHRGTPNATVTPRALVTIRYVRSWYSDASRDVNAIPHSVWNSLTEDQQRMMRFPVQGKSRPRRTEAPILENES